MLPIFIKKSNAGFSLTPHCLASAVVSRGRGFLSLPLLSQRCRIARQGFFQFQNTADTAEKVRKLGAAPSAQTGIHRLVSHQNEPACRGIMDAS